jgi:hypothetical protein
MDERNIERESKGRDGEKKGKEECEQGRRA